MNKFKALLLVGLLAASSAFADIEQVFSDSRTGTTSATAFVPHGGGAPANITAVSWRLDSGVTTGFVAFRPGRGRFAVTSGVASGATIFVSNTGTIISALDSVIFFDESDSDGNPYTLHTVTAAATTSITVNPTVGVTSTTSDVVWHVPLAEVAEFPVSSTGLTTTSSTAFQFGKTDFWFNGQAPVAVTIDGNTTSCRIGISGVRTHSR